MKKIKFILLVLLLFFLFNFKDVYAIENNFEYVISKYDVNIKVNENNTLDIKEEITAKFLVPKHGIFRKIPIKNTIKRNDGTITKNRTLISNVKVNSSFKKYKSGNYYVIKIGDSNNTLTGEKTYSISYNYNLGKDPLKDIDEFYFNIIGTEWDTTVSNISFSITMPKDIDKDKLGISSGSKGNIGSNIVAKYNEDKKEIYGNYYGTLNPYEGITIRAELEDGYFKNAYLPINYFNYIVYIFPLIFLLISIFLWYKYGRDEEVVEIVEFYPPEGFNSLEIGFLYKGIACNQDVISLLIYLANKGYIKIGECDEKSLFSITKSFKITKLKEYDGNNINEELFLKGLFNKNNLLQKEKQNSNNINEVRAIDLYDNFYITLNKILENINNKENKSKIFEKKASGKKIFVILMILASYILITLPPIINYGETNSIIFALLFPAIGFTFMFSVLFNSSQTIYVNGVLSTIIAVKVFVIFWGLMFGGIPWCLMVLPALMENLIFLICYIIGIICILGMFICFKYLPKRTKYGNEILGKLKGFKNFLETAEKDRLEAMVEKNPTYFYDILPYTYVLGVSDKWIKKFETIAVCAPYWYDSQNSFDVVAFSSFINSTMSSAQNVMSSSPSTNSDGGGSSGGGSGGGGGGSW